MTWISSAEPIRYFFVKRAKIVEDGYEFFCQRHLVTVFSAPNYCSEFDNSAAMMSIDENLYCSFLILQPAEKKAKPEKTSAKKAKPKKEPAEKGAKAPKAKKSTAKKGTKKK